MGQRRLRIERARIGRRQRALHVARGERRSVELLRCPAGAELRVDVNGGGNDYQTVAVLQNYTFNSASEVVKVLFEDNASVKHTDNI